jgi:uncharacterized membrane protein YfcA
MNIEITPLNAIIILLVGIITGVINTVAGGGSLLTLPIMIFMGLPPNIANATNRVAIFAQNVFSFAGFKSKGVTVFPYSYWLSASAFVGALIGAKLAIDIDGALFNKILSITMLVVLFIIIFRPGHKVGQEESLTFKSQSIGVFSFFFIGLYGGFLQAGIGFLMIALLTSVNGLSLAKTNSIKVFVALIYTAGALAVFIYEDKINWSFGIMLGIGNAVGGWVTSRWSADKGDKVIRVILIISVTVMAIKLWFF